MRGHHPLMEHVLARARGGDPDAFGELMEGHRRELQLHCYRILGSVDDAEDMVQETLLAAWRGLDRFEGRASLRAWLYRIATNRCLNALRHKGRRRALTPAPAVPQPTRLAEPTWLEPYPDVLLEGIADHAPGPEARYETKESVELAFITGLQLLPPTQRVVVVLRDVLGFPSGAVADMLDTSEASVKGALRRARATLRGRLEACPRDRAPQPNSLQERELVARFAHAIEHGDIDDMIGLLTEDARLTMPPHPHQYQGRATIASFLEHRAWLQGALLRAVATRANTQPAFGCYLRLPHTAIARPYGLLVLTIEGNRIAAMTWFSDTSAFPRFGLPRAL